MKGESTQEWRVGRKPNNDAWRGQDSFIAREIEKVSHMNCTALHSSRLHGIIVLWFWLSCAVVSLDSGNNSIRLMEVS